ncbi:prolyl oligopeptidase family serine peptidase [Paenibacillus doosanensis]|uniref:S9 family peptidase n=1 Tax=Paenibacillus doosanensis TaxID=1229154 RepID=UPI00217F8EB8|nr:alpha/beta fold hydrolase [Paenibacillus doosanensis]MCS7464423.1 prolyl oligopeptidase family serine peptidase [Paenibacillus doosanensis]
MAAIIWICAAALPVSASETNASSQGYADVPKDHYASKEIEALSQRGIIQGTGDGLFKPEEEVTRGVTALWLSKALKLGYPASLQGFTDVPETSEYAVAVNALAEKKIIQGDGGRFFPDMPLTREQMASLLVRAFQLKDNGMNVWFKDETEMGESHFKDIIRLKQYFLTDQIEFMPKNKVTRAQLALFLYRAIMIGEPERGELPLEDFMRGSELGGYQVSPDGKRTALLKEYHNQQHIFVYKKGEEKEDAERITTVKDRDITGFFWFDNSTLLYMTNRGGDEDYHIHAVSADGSSDKDLTPFEKEKAQYMESLSYIPGHENDILISLNHMSKQLFDVYEVNVKTGEFKIVANNPGNITSWMTDLYGEVKLAKATVGTDTQILYRKSTSLAFEPILDVKFGDSFVPIMFSFDNSQLFALSNIGRDKLALVAFNLNTKTMGDTIYENPDADVTDIVVSYKKQAILAVEYETDKVHYHYLDEEFERLNKDIAGQLPENQQFYIVGNPLPDKKVTLRTYSDKSPGAYYFYDRQTKSLEKYADVKPWIHEDDMAEMKPISYASRDGYTINGYLTLPKGAAGAKLPVVVLPHGGPWARDSWGFDPEVQLLANRGYAVLQMNFRGSTGYGKKFLNAGNKEWGRAMQNDITDGVNWLIAQGIADPKRVAIYGGSYGGYAALAGVTYTPDLYVAAVDYVGPSSMFTFLNSMPAYWEPDRQVMYRQVGDPDKDKAMLEASSPLLHADQIKAPIFFAQGVNDPRVSKKESDQMVMALRQRGIDSPYMIKADEGHGFQNYENRMDFYNALLKFLSMHLKP